MSGSLIPSSRNILDAAQGRLELRWCGWPGDWSSFVDSVKSEGSSSELQVLERFPDEFKSRAIEKASRLSQWQENSLMGLLSQMAELTKAMRVDQKTGEETADNPVRYQATKFLLERTLGKTPESSSVVSHTGEVLKDVVERREELRRILTEKGDQIEETVRVERRSVGEGPSVGGEPGSGDSGGS